MGVVAQQIPPALAVAAHWAAQCPAEQLAATAADFNQLHTQAAQWPASKQPVLVHMLGLPGSGKSTVAGQLHQQLGNSFYALDWDAVMLKLAPFHADVPTLGNAAASHKWELPARHYGYALLHTLVQRRANILWDHGACNPHHPALLAWAKQQGYTTAMVHVDVPLDTALQRVHTRNALAEATGGRVIPATLVTERHALLAELKPQYEALVDVFVHLPHTAPAPAKTLADIAAQLLGKNN
ncbi:MAG: ATP-binding protein [Alphaproteobacteria bacterium]